MGSFVAFSARIGTFLPYCRASCWARKVGPMSQKAFFPDPLFGWLFYVALIGILSVAAYIDWRRLIVPKWITLPLLALGLAINVVRGAWLGARGEEVWTLAPSGALAGAADGLLFSLAGFFFGLAVFILLWLLGTCGGGDVKLFAAVASWIGPIFTFDVLIGTLGSVLLISILRLTWSVVVGGSQATRRDFSRKAGKVIDPHGLQARKRLLSFSLPVALAAAVVLLWVFRADLQLVAPHSNALVARVSHAG